MKNMKRKSLMLLLTVAMAATSLESTAFVASGADFTSEEEYDTQIEYTEAADSDISVDYSEEEGDVVPETEVDVADAENQTVDLEESQNIENEMADFSSESVGYTEESEKTVLTSLTYTPSKTEAVWGEFNPIEGTLTATDENGVKYDKEIKLTNLKQDGKVVIRWMGNQITFRLKYANGDSVVSNFDEVQMWVFPGQYTYWFETGDLKTKPENLTVKIPSYPSMKLGKNDNCTVDGHAIVSFTPEETDHYYYKVENSSFGTEIGAVYYMGIYGQRQYVDDNWNGEADLKKGTRYYFYIQGYKHDAQGNPEKENVTVTITKNAEDCEYETTTIPATCTKEGKIIKTCKIHGESTTEVIPKKAHTVGKWTTVKSATVLAEGSSVQKCTVCGTVLNSKVIAKLPATLNLNVTAKKTIPMQVKQSFSAKAAGLATADGVKSWTSSNKKVATVSASGKIVAKKAGTATITVTLNSGYTTWFKVKVQKKAVATSSLKVLNKSTGKAVAKKITLKRKEKLNLLAVTAPITSKQKVTYTSSKKSVATVNSKGVVTAKKKGKATITVKSGKKTVKIQVTVK